MIPFSVLDLAPVPQGSTPGDALRNSRDLAQHAERRDYHRFWLAEHHNMPGIASAATSVAIGYVAEGTKTIRVGAGGVMLPNHSPLVIAEQFGTLESLYPGRIDLGLGRAPGTDMATTRALRRDSKATGDEFPESVKELQAYFAPAAPGQRVRAFPGNGLRVPIWLLGSSLFSAQLAAAMGLPYAFASHFAPTDLLQAVQLYRDGFQPSRELQRPYVMLGLNVVAADSDAEARRLFTSHQQAFVSLRRGTPGQIPPPIDDIESYWTLAEKAMASQSLLCSVVGAPATVERGLRKFIEVTKPDELMVTGLFYSHKARLRSYELVAQIRDRLPAERKSAREPVSSLAG
jgi:luciferase family oxidoreductase group 1